MNNKILMSFYNKDLDEIVVITDEEENIYALNKTKCSIANYKPIGSLLNLFELINFEEKVEVDYQSIAGLSYYLGLYSDELDKSILNNMLRVLNDQHSK